MKSRNRLTALVLALIMLCAMIPSQVFATGELTLQPIDTVPDVILGETETVEIGAFEGSAQGSIEKMTALTVTVDDPDIADITVEHTGKGDGVSLDFVSYAASADKKKPREATLEEEGFAINKDLTSERVYGWQDTLFKWDSCGLNILMNTAGMAVAIDVEVPEDGYYTLAVQGDQGKTGATFEFSVHDGDAETVMGQYSFYQNAATSVGAEKVMGGVYLKKGTVTVIAEKVADKNYLFLSKVKLLPIGDTVKLNVTGKQMGTTAVTVASTIDGVAASGSFDVTVKGVPGIFVNLEDATVFEEVKTNETVSTALNIVVDGYPTAASDIVLDARLEDGFMGDAEIRVDGDTTYLDVTAQSAGITNVVLTVSNDTYDEKEIKFPMTIKGSEYIYSFFKLQYGKNGADGYQPNTVTSWSQTTMGDPAEMNATRGVYTDPWIYNGVGGSGGFFVWADQNYGVMIGPNKGCNGSVIIDVAESGAYAVGLDILEYASGGIAQIYIAPEDAESPMDAKYLVGDPIDSYSTTMKYKSRKMVGNTALEAGKYIVTIEMVDKNEASDAYRLGFGNIVLLSPTTREIRLNGNLRYVPVGYDRSAEVTATINGVAVDLSEFTDIELTNANEDIVDASIRLEGEQLFIDATGIVPGDAELTLTAKYHGEDEVSTTILLTVLPADALFEAKAELPVDYAEADQTVQLTATGVLADGTIVTPETEGVSFDYESSNTDVAWIDANGLITTRTMGEVTFMVYVTKGDEIRQISVPFIVTTTSPIASVTLNGLDGLALGSSTNYSVSGRLANGMPIPNTANIEFVLVEESDALTLSKNGTAVGKNEGTAIIKAIVTMPTGDSMETAEKTVTVYDPSQFEEDDGLVSGEPAEVFIDFKSYLANTTLTPRDYTMAAVGWEVNSKLTSSVIMGLDRKLFRWQAYGLNCLLEDEVLVLDINIPGDGVYQFAVDGGQYAAGAYAQFFMNGKYLGEYDMYSNANLISGGEVKLNTVELKGGVNQLYIKRGTHNSNSKAYLYLGSLRFTPVDELPTKGDVAIGTTHAVMSMGETGWLYPGTQMSDGTSDRVGYVPGSLAEDPDNVIKSVTVDNASVIALEDNYKITAMAPGTATFTMQAIIDGTEYNETLEIVVDDQKLGSVTATLAQPELCAGESSAITVEAAMADGRKVELDDVVIAFASADESVAKVVDGVLEVYKEGDVQITISATMAGTTVDTILPISVLPPLLDDVVIKSPSNTMKPDSDGFQVSVIGITAEGLEMEIPSATITWSTTTPDLINISETGYVTPKALGAAVIKAKVSYQGYTYNPEFVITVREGKTGPTYYSDARIAAMEKNIETYDWAKKTKDAAVEAGDNLLKKKDDFLDFAYNNLITSQEIPRAASVEFRLDPQMFFCKYCGVDMRKDYASYGYLHDPYNYPWKIQCPDCRRRFPSNDFASFYKAGLNEHGLFDYQKALADGQEFLKNTEFPEKGEGWAVDDSRGYATGNTYAYSQVAYMKNYFNIDVPAQMPEKWNFIAYYAHWGLYHVSAKGQAYTALETLTNAYIYSQDPKYGRIAAILLDRLADQYPEMYIKPWFPYYFNSDSTTPLGKHVGCIWQHGFNRTMVKAYDALYYMYDDPYVIDYLSKKAAELKIDKDYEVPDYLSNEYKLYGFQDPEYVEPTITKQGNPKTSAELIRQNIETNILAETAEDLYTGQIHGNFGMHQSLAAYTAVVWDTQPYTGELIDWMNASSNDDFIAAAQGKRLTGANFIRTITQTVSRDGTGNEASPNYNNLWVPYAVLDALAGYEGYAAADQFQNPKILMMYKQNFPLTLQRRETAAIGDSGAVTDNPLMSLSMGRPFLATGDVEMGQYLYLKNGNTTKNMHDGIFDDSSMMAEMVDAIIEEHGEMDLDRSQQMTGFGFSINRGGTKIADPTAPLDNQRYNYIYYGRNAGHGHQAALDFEMGAFGMKITADLGYPEAADGGYKNTYWGKGTINHNLVMVNAANQSGINVGFPLHFDDSGRVKLIDVEAPKAYGPTEEYRRTVMMVEVDDDTAYSVDFFRVKGGDDHIYSFHAVSNDVTENSLASKMIAQKKGTYAGKNIGIGGQEKLGIYNAFDFLYNVRRASYPGNTFQMDFKIDDIQKVGRNNVHLKMTMLNDFDLTEVALAKGAPPQRDNNPEELEFVLARRQGKNLDSLFTTVFEPYNGESYIASQEVVPMKRIGGHWEDNNDASKAVKVTLKNGRVDYIVYATNNKILYEVDGLFKFQGFAGVYSLEKEGDTVPVYAYVNDGVQIGETTGLDAYTGIVVDFQKEAVLDNYITVSMKGEYDPYRLVGQHIYVENDGVDNGVYEIKGVEVLDDGNVKLDLGTITLIRGMVDEYDLSAGYTYNIKKGQKFSIPLSTIDDDSPVWEKIGTQAVTVGNTLSVPLSAVTKSGAEVTYELASELRGANVVGDTFYFNPDKGQVGDNHAAVTAKNGTLETTIHFSVTVYPATSGGGGKPSAGGGGDSGSTSGGGGSGSGGGGGGGSTEPDDSQKVTYTDQGNNIFMGSDGSILSAGPDKTPGTADDITNIVKGADGSYSYTNANGETMTAGADGLLGTADDAKVESGTEAPADPSEKFVDLGNHAWAKEAIYRLVEAGVIKGVADDKFAPANAITRADFATLLVRAWKLEAEEIGTYDDVAESDYYYNEVGIASALGIVKGVGEGKFAPKAPITREQMMVMLHRTLVAVEAEIAEAAEDVLADFSDADMISEYAIESVGLMVGNGYIQGANGKINPQGNATRAEVAVLLDRILDK